MNLAKNSLDSSVSILKHQDAIQQQTLENVKGEVKLLQSINAQPQARGFLALSISCNKRKGPDNDGSEQTAEDLVGWDENERFQHRKFRSEYIFNLKEGEVYECSGAVRNPGNKPIDSFEVSLRFHVGFGDSYQKSVEIDRIYPSNWVPLRPEGGTETIISSRSILPVSQDEKGSGFFFFLRIPATEESGKNTIRELNYGTLEFDLTTGKAEPDSILIDLWLTSNESN